MGKACQLSKWNKEISHCQIFAKESWNLTMYLQVWKNGRKATQERTFHRFRMFYHLYTGLSWLAVTQCDLSHQVLSKLLRLVSGNNLAASVQFRTNVFKEPQSAKCSNCFGYMWRRLSTPGATNTFPKQFEHLSYNQLVDQHASTIITDLSVIE